MEKNVELQKTSFFKKYGVLLTAICGAIAVGFLVMVVASLEIKLGIREYGESVYMAFAFLALGVLAISMHKVKEDFDAVASLLFILAIPMFLLIFMYMSEEYAGVSLPVAYYLGLIFGILFSGLGAMLALSVSFAYKPISTKDMAEEGVLLALAFIFNLFGFRVVKGGGSTNLQMLPLFIIALRRGPVHGLVCGGIIYGLVTCLTDGYGIATFPFDYLIGFGSVMILGLFRNQILGKEQKWYNLKGEVFLFVGALLATMVRFVGSTASSMILWKYTFAAAIAYNVTYIPSTGLLGIVFIMAVYGPLLRINNRFPARSIYQ